MAVQVEYQPRVIFLLFLVLDFFTLEHIEWYGFPTELKSNDLYYDVPNQTTWYTTLSMAEGYKSNTKIRE